MTLKAWKEKYYPKTASPNMTIMQALDHSILKWSGLSKAALDSFALTRHKSLVDDDNEGCYFIVAVGTCALCVKFFDNLCAGCPLYEVRGNTRCCDELGDEQVSPYNEFTVNGNPRLMLRWLRKAKKMLEAE